MKLPNKKYKIIYADPPWRYTDTNKSERGGTEDHYETMSLDDIKNLPVKDITTENAALFLWVTFPKLNDGVLDVFEAWGFKYKTIAFNWVKLNKNNNKVWFGIGHYTKSNTEVCLLGIKGKMPVIDNTVSSVVMTNRERHSKKPDIIRDKIVQLYGDVPKIELFARQTADGWDSWGNEVS